MQTPSKEILSDKQVREKLLLGVEKISQAVGSTLGPMGRNVIIETPYGATTVTKDGVTVAKHLSLEDPVANLAVSIIKQAASKTATSAGDGTTTSTIIASALVQEAYRLIELGFQPIEIKREFEKLLAYSLGHLEKLRSEVSDEDITKIATISANNDEELGALIKEAYDYVGKTGLISLGESRTGQTTIDLIPGISIDKGYSSPYFVTDSSKNEVVLEKPLVFITDNKLRHHEDVIPILEIAAENRRPLFIIADSIDGQALQVLVYNKLRGTIQVSAIESPSFGDNRAEILKDLAAITSAKIFSASQVLTTQQIDASFFGQVERIISSKDKTILINPKKDHSRIEERLITLSKETPLIDEDNTFLLNIHRKRIADLTASVAMINVGASTETELKEKKDRVDDALRATAAAVSKGYLTGGGSALLSVSKLLPKNSPIQQAFVKALQEPLSRIVANAGKNPEVVLDKILSNESPNFGFDARALDYSDLKESGIIDPFLVVCQALINAVSASNMLVISSTSMTNTDRTPPYSPPPLDYA